MSLGTICLTLAVLVLEVGSYDIRVLLGLVPIVLCIGAFMLPISIIGAYWQYYLINKLLG